MRGGGRGQRRRSAGGRREGRGTREGPFLLAVVDEVAAHPVWTEADGVEGAAWLRFVLWVSVEIAQLFGPMRKLTLAAVLAEAAFGERSAQFGLVARRRGGNGGGGGGGARLQCGGADVGVVGFEVAPVPAEARCRGAARLHHADGALREEPRLSPYVGVGQLGG